jgi:hypothetical protein
MGHRNRKYRKIYKEHHGNIPKDEKGRSFDIHHLDGDHTNNNINNLVALSIQDHYKKHYDQGDWGAAWAISKRFNLDPLEKSKLISEMNKARAASGTHPSQVMKNNGTHPFQNKSFQKIMVTRCIEQGKHSSQQVWQCEKCGKEGKHLVNYNRYHGANCGAASTSQGKVWVNNGLASKMVTKDELAQLKTEGWVPGRGSVELTPRRANAKGTVGRANPYIRKTTRPYNRKEKS